MSMNASDIVRDANSEGEDHIMTITSMKFARILVGMAVLALCLTPAWATASDESEEQERRIEIKRKVQCEGDDCSEAAGAHKIIFVDDEGNEKVIEGDGDYTWIGGDHDKMKVMMRGPGGKGGFLGVQLTDLTPELRTHFGVPVGAGVMVSKVVDESAAQAAGIQVGDIITLVNSDEVSSGGALAHAIGAHEGGEDVTLEIWRDGAVQRVTATLGESKGGHMKMMPRIHMRHGGDGAHGMRRIEIRCEDGDEDCGAGLEGVGDYDCGADECEVRVECTDDGCTCTVNGEDADCADIPGVPHQ